MSFVLKRYVFKKKERQHKVRSLGLGAISALFDHAMDIPLRPYQPAALSERGEEGWGGGVGGWGPTPARSWNRTVAIGPIGDRAHLVEGEDLAVDGRGQTPLGREAQWGGEGGWGYAWEQGAQTKARLSVMYP